MKKEFDQLIATIIETPEFQKRKTYKHHDDSVYDHCIEVAWKTYIISRRLRIDWKSATIGALLHDFYPTCWQTNNKKGKIWEAHGFAHAKAACENVAIFFPQHNNKKIRNIIKRHMFPLNITPPLYIESWVVMCVDKYVSLRILKKPKDWPKYLGIKKVK